MAKHIQTTDEFDEAIKTDKLVLVDFYADWCGPCKMIAPKLEEFAKEFPNLVVLKVNVDELDDIAERHKVSAMPTFKFLKDEKEVGELVGANAEKLHSLIKELL